MIAIIIKETDQQSDDQKCPNNSISNEEGSCTCNNFNDIFDDIQWKCLRKCPSGSQENDDESCTCNNGDYFDKFAWICKTKVVLGGSRACPRNSAKTDDGTCLCDYANNIFDETHWICCPDESIANDQGFCTCRDEKDYFDRFHWQCIPKLYLPSTTPPPSTTPYVPTNYTYKPIPCENDETRFFPFCFNFTIIPGDPCPEGQVGYPPNCFYPCPQYYMSKC